MSTREEIIGVAAQLAAPIASKFVHEITSAPTYGIKDSDLDAHLFVPNMDAYVALAEKLLAAVDRWHAKQQKPPQTIAPRSISPSTND